MQVLAKISQKERKKLQEKSLQQKQKQPLQQKRKLLQLKLMQVKQVQTKSRNLLYHPKMLRLVFKSHKLGVESIYFENYII